MRIKAMEESIFLTSSTKEAFNQLRRIFTEAPILQYFDPKCHIRIETDISDYIISRILNQLISDQVTLDSKSNLTKSNFGLWHLIAYFLEK